MKQGKKVKPANKDKVTAIDGGGTTAYAATIEWYLEHDMVTIPTRGIYAVTVPGTLDSWVVTHKSKLPYKMYSTFA